ncbi:IMPACT family member YigZ [bacterium BMS3Abin04]|nr:IMPACT family member YigZ [bacterium BMS3Abin04]
MSKENTIKTISDFSEFKLKEKGSVFIAQVYPVNFNEEAEQTLSNIKKKYFDATHHCFAYRLSDNIERYSDDGEPSGTAGVRILNAIEHFDLVDIIVVVIRYFGGTKLGVGPLGKAYYQSALEVLKQSEIIEKSLFKKIKIVYDYEQTSKIHHFISKYDAKNIVNGFIDKPFIECLVEIDKIDNMIAELIEATGNKIEAVKSDKNYLI